MAVNIKRKKLVVAVSGGFDPVHIGHVRLFQAAKNLGDTLVVILNNDHWLRKKKGFVFMPQRERKEIIGAFRSVDRVMLTRHRPHPKDMSVGRELLFLKPDIFANGGDRNVSETVEHRVCRKIGCREVFGVGRGGKVQSSSWLLAKHLKRAVHPVTTGRPVLSSRGGGRNFGNPKEASAFKPSCNGVNK